MTGVLTQTGALFVDAYRELNARKLFWITLSISAAVVLGFAAVGINPRGITFLWWEFPHPFLNSRQLPGPLLYKFVFATLAIPIWLAWIANILALISTASIVPEFLAGGAIELTLSKPISRLRLFFTKYATALLFAALQVTVFTVACFLLIGIRGGAWEPRLFLAIPIMILFFSYLYCVCTLLGMLTRSTIAALLLTLLFWMVIAGAQSTEGVFLMFKVRNQLQEQKLMAKLEAAQAQLAKNADQTAKLPQEDQANRNRYTLAREATLVDISNREKQLESIRSTGRIVRRGQDISFAVVTVLPKTGQTVELLKRSLLSIEDLQRFDNPNARPDGGFGDEEVPVNTKVVVRRMEEELRSRTIAWVVGTSLLFEALVLAISARVFLRRDF
jgi:hypothetical protein